MIPRDDGGKPPFDRTHVWFSRGAEPWGMVLEMVEYFEADRGRRLPVVHRHALDAAAQFHHRAESADAAALSSVAEVAAEEISLRSEWMRVNTHILAGTLTVRAVLASITLAVRQTLTALARQGDAIANGRAVSSAAVAEAAAAEPATSTGATEQPDDGRDGDGATGDDSVRDLVGGDATTTPAGPSERLAMTTAAAGMQKRVVRERAPKSLVLFSAKILLGESALTEREPAPRIYVLQLPDASPQVTVEPPSAKFRQLILQKTRGQARCIGWHETCKTYDDNALWLLIKGWFKSQIADAAYIAGLPVETRGPPPLPPRTQPARQPLRSSTFKALYFFFF